MTFTYISSQTGEERLIGSETSEQIRQHLVAQLPPESQGWTYGQLQDALISFRLRNDHRMLINQLAPIFLWVTLHNRVWDADEESGEAPA